MKIFNSLLLLLIISFLFPVSSSAAPLKIGIVNMQEIIQNSKVGKKALAKLKKQAANKKELLQSKDQNLRKKQAQLQQSVVLSPDARAKKEKELIALQRSLQIEFERTQNEFRKQEMQETQVIVNSIRKIIAVYAKKTHYDLILERTLYSAVLYMNNKPKNITKIILIQYNKQN